MHMTFGVVLYGVVYGSRFHRWQSYHASSTGIYLSLVLSIAPGTQCMPF